ncbi:hypothetical protein [Rhodoluna limnophila]|uniref:hypothetical protein n=1 Tax=Rhodoluna limnophila TaxID=232537 RepID=UPI0011063881|nr:hypothetical protein [Rhodoluna limnophila]
MKSKNSWTIGAGALMVVVVLATIFLGIMPTLVQVRSLDSASETVRDENVNHRQFLETLKENAADKVNLLISVTKQRLLVPNQLHIVEVMAELDGVASENSVAVQNLSVSAPQQYVAPTQSVATAEFDQAVAKLPSGSFFVSELSVSVSGTQAEISDFVEALGQASRYILISKFVIAEAVPAKGNDVTADIAAQLFTLAN